MRMVPRDHVHDDDGAFDVFAARVRERFAATTAATHQLFTVETPDLWEIYLRSFPDGFQRQWHNCNCCRRFIQRYGNLVMIDTDGGVHSAMWHQNEIPPIYALAARNLQMAVEWKGKITGVFCTKEPIWGEPFVGNFTHFAVKPEPGMLHADKLLTPFQAMAAKREDYRTLTDAVGLYSKQTIETAIELLKKDALYRGAKFVGPAQFLLDIHDTKRSKSQKHREARVWAMVARAPAGFCTPRSGMIGTLLDDIKDGMSYEQVAARFKAKMHPLAYQRPQAAPKAGNIAQAEKIVEQLGIAPSLRRRYARLCEIDNIWQAAAMKTKATTGLGVFDHLKPAPAGNLQFAAAIPTKPITFEKFRSKVLPTALRIEAFVEGSMPFTGMVTAVDPTAPPILQWDDAGHRNPVSWFMYHGHNSPADWGLTNRSWYDVAAITLLPPHWKGQEERFKHWESSAIFVIPQMQDKRTPGLCLFPEILKKELHAVRSTIEAHSLKGKMERDEEASRASANGLRVGGGLSAGATFLIRVTSKQSVMQYKIDRWD